MLNFDEARFLGIQSGAVGLARELDDAVAACLDGGAENLHFLGTGGAAILMQPAVQLLQQRSRLPVFGGYSAEVLVAEPVHLTDKSVVVIPSLSGTTKESVDLLAYAKARGATVIALVGDGETPVGTGADYTFVNAAADDTSSESFYLQSLLIALAVLGQRGEMANCDALVAETAAAPAALLAVKQAVEPAAPGLAERLAAHDYHIFTGAGNAWPEAFYFGMCILEEMQWIRTRPVHAADFFHGTLELVEDGVSVVVLKGEDAARPLAERVEAFVPTANGVLTVIDTAGYEAPGLSADLRGLLAPALLATMLERVAAHLEVLRDHPLTTRRYYRRVAY